MRRLDPRTVIASSRERRRDIEVAKLVAERDGPPLHADYLKGLIIDESEMLHLRRLHRRILAAWVALDVIVLAVLAAARTNIDALGIPTEPALFAWVLVGTLLLSLVLLYNQQKLIRKSEARIRKLNIADRRNRLYLGQDSSEGLGVSPLREHKNYRAELPEVIANYRAEANRYRRWHNFFQGIIIMGSVVTSAITTASVLNNSEVSGLRWVFLQ